MTSLSSQQREKEEEKARRELEKWNRMKRLEKIKHLKRKWQKETEEKGNIESHFEAP